MTSGLQLLHELLLKQWKDSDYQADFVAEAGQLVQELLTALEDSIWMLSTEEDCIEVLGQVLTDHQADAYYGTQRMLDIYCAELLAGRIKATPEGFAHVASRG